MGPGHRFVGVVMLGSAVVLIGGALQWREIAIRWHVAQIQGDKWWAYFKPDELVLQPKGTVRYDALVRYARTPEGKDGLLRRYMALVDNQHVRHLWDDLAPGGENAILLLWVETNLCLGLGAWADLPHAAGAEEGSSTSNSNLMPALKGATPSLELTHRLQDLLLEVGYDEYRVPGRAGVRFSVVSCGSPDARCRRHYPAPLLDGLHACLFESSTYTLPATSSAVSWIIKGNDISR